VIIPRLINLIIYLLFEIVTLMISSALNDFLLIQLFEYVLTDNFPGFLQVYQLHKVFGFDQFTCLNQDKNLILGLFEDSFQVEHDRDQLFE
jgi:hypothetical protein